MSGACSLCPEVRFGYSEAALDIEFKTLAIANH